MTPKADSQWILLRGLTRESRHWGRFPGELEKKLLAHGHSARVDSIDLPGTGRYSEMRSPVTIKEITSFVREKFVELRRRLREQGETPPPKVYLVSISLGSMVACDWIERWPGDFSGVVLMNTSFKGFSPMHRRLTPGAYAHLFQALRAQDPVKREHAVLSLISNRPEQYAELAKEWADIQLSRPVSYENFARQLTAAALYQPGLPKPGVPVLLLNSASDRMVHPSCSQDIARRWEAPLVVHPSAGHELPLDEPEFTAAEIVQWYDSGAGVNLRTETTPQSRA